MHNINDLRPVCLVVGASGTIGSAVARRLSRNATSLGLHYCRNRAAVEKMSQDFEKTGKICRIFQAELITEEGCRELVAEVRRSLGALDMLAFCHGNVCWQDWHNLNWRDWEGIFRQHCLAVYTMVNEALNYMMEAGYGRIVYLSSISPKYAGSSRSIHYAAAKGALEVAMRGLARETARSGVCINGVRAGFVMSPQQLAGRNERELEERIAKIPMGRAGKAKEIAAAFEYLMSDDAGFMTGEIITVAGGD